ncbi:MAG: peptidylprolyl isomerase [Eubacterium sp.]|nr:peptidylprolyl isomerase [Eubacterium sp.]
MKKITTAAALLLVCAMGITGCSDSILTSSDTSGESKPAEIWTANDDDIVAWSGSETLSDEEKEFYNIAFKEFYSEYAFFIDMNQIDEYEEDYQTDLQLYRQQMIEMLAEERVVLKKAQEAGLDVLTAEEAEEVSEYYENNMQAYYTAFAAEAKEALGSDADKDALLAKERELFLDYIVKFGLSEEIFLKWQTNTYIYSKMMDKITEDVTVSKEAIDTYIDTTQKEAEAMYNESVATYEAATDYQAVWIPDGSRNIKFILLAIDSSDAAELSAARAESNADNDALDKLRDEMLATVKGQADAAMEKLNSGEASFEDVMKEYAANYYEGAEKNLTLLIYGSERTMKEIYDAAYALEKPGDITDLIATDRGYYIIQYVSDAEITDEQMEDVRKATEQGMIAERQAELKDKTIAQWMDEVAYEYNYDALNYEKPSESDKTSSQAESKE